MGVGRRGFLGLAAGAVAAAPSMAREAVGSASRLGTGLGLAGQMASGQIVNNVISKHDEITNVQNQIARLIGKSAAEIAREKRQMTVREIDGDIMEMKSLAWHAKVRMQRDRDYEFQMAGHRSYLEGWLDSLLGGDD